ncbi:MAG TPA: PorP/SprF family type IX secretion system membrane protein [Bacteroidia bacterium]
MKKIIFAVVLNCFAVALFAQDIHFSQLSQSPLLINPANTGLFDGYHRAIINYRSQWASAGSPYKTMAASFDSEIGMKKKKSAYLGIGGFIFQDKAGAASWKQFKADIFLNGILKVGKESHLALAVGGGYGQNSANFSALTFGNQYDGKEFSQELANNESIVFRNFNYADLSSGIVYEFDKTNVNFDHNNSFKLKVGFAGYHLNQPKYVYGGAEGQKLNARYVGSLGGQYDFKGTRLSLISNNYYMMQGKYHQLNVGAMMRMRFNDGTKITGIVHETSLYLGCSMRVGDAVIPTLMYEMYGFMLGLSYDYNISPYKPSTNGNGGFEVSLRWVNLRDGLHKQGREFGK